MTGQETNDSLRRIVAGALSLAESQAFGETARVPPDAATRAFIDANPALRQLARQLFPGLDTALAFDGVDPAAIDTLPDWAHELASFLQRPRGAAGLAPEPTSDALFSAALAPLLDHIRPSLPDQGDDIRIVQDGALRWLGERLHFLAVRILATECRLFDSLPAAGASSRHERFTAFMRDEGWLAIFAKYPVLARTCFSEIRRWRANLARLSARLLEHRSAIADRFGLGSAPLTGFGMGLSDLHNGGQSVCKLHFGNGAALAYKPRSSAIEMAYARVLNDLDGMCAPVSEHYLPLSGCAVDALECGDHSWVRWVPRQPCAQASGIAQYYRRFGQLLAVNQLLGIGDVHPENIIANGEFPTIVDLEVAFRPAIGRQRDARHPDYCETALRDSVVHTHMCPAWIAVDAQTARDSSGWLREDGQLPQCLREIWSVTPEGDVQVATRPASIEPSHLPALDDRVMPAHEWAEDIIAGAETLYRALLRQPSLKAALRRSLHTHCAGVRVRYLLRDTAVYQNLAHRLTSPSCNLSGIRRSLEICALRRGAPSASHDTFNALIRAEHAQTEDDDVPYFTAGSDETAIRADGRLLPDAFAASGLSEACRRIADLDEQAAARQIDWIVAGFHGRFHRADDPRARRAIASRPKRAIPAGADELPAIPRESRRIETLLRDAAIFHRPDACGWLGARPVAASDRIQAYPVGADLYDGLAGIALFLAMRVSLSGSESARPLLAATLNGMHDLMSQAPLAHGYGTGAGGVAYAAGYVSAATGEPQARALLARILDAPPPLPDGQAPAGYDLLDGLAGTIAGLCQAWRWTHEPRLLFCAEHYGDHLAAAFEPACASLLDAHGGSLAHGADGLRLAFRKLAAALARAGRDAPARRFAALADLAGARIDVTRSLRGKGSWCHGEAGWLAGRRPGAAPALVSAVETCIGAFPAHLCCGELGRLDALLAADTSEPRLAMVRHRLERLIQAASSDGAYPFYLNAPETLLPSLFTGLTGVGYLCERVTHDPQRAKLPMALFAS